MGRTYFIENLDIIEFSNLTTITINEFLVDLSLIDYFNYSLDWELIKLRWQEEIETFNWVQ